MRAVTITSPSRDFKGEITLSGSKSISNRVLLIRALCKQRFQIFNLSDSTDTTTLDYLLSSDADILDAHHGGTTFRFLTAYLALKAGKQILTGSDRMKQRPIKALVDALIHLGADISYIENDGFPPLAINSPHEEWKSEVTLPANISSQYISALLLIAPVLKNGLTLHLVGDIVSRPYIEMTLEIMKYFGVQSSWEDLTIRIDHQPYVAKDFYVEADWSAASYYYNIAGFSDTSEIILKGLGKNSLQGDAQVVLLAEKFGITTTYGDHQIKIVKTKDLSPIEHFEYNFISVPDLAQSVSVMCAGLGIQGLFSGLQTLRIKETDRIAGLQNELVKMQVYLSKMPAKFSQKTGIEYFMQDGKATSTEEGITIDTYDDHRMAMSFATLSVLFEVQINDPMVISKSYPNFWKDLKSLGFLINEV